MDYTKAQRLVAEGKNIKQIAQAFNLTPRKMRDIRKKDPKLDDILAPLKHANPNIDYKQVEYLANLQCAEYEIAQAIKYSPESFSVRKKKDKLLRDALDKGYIDGKVSLRRAQFRSSVDRYLTICKDCQKIYDGEFMPSCVYCDAGEPNVKLRGAGGRHTNVKHKFVPGNVTAQIWLGKQVLHQSDNPQEKVEGSGSGLREMRAILKERRGKRIVGMEEGANGN